MSEPLRLTRAEQGAWVEKLDAKLAFCDRTLLPIYESDGGAVTIDAAVSRAVYVVIDPDDYVVYVGMVDRTAGVVADRFRDHHKYTEAWDRVWVLALSDSLVHDDVREVEDALIRHFEPVGNDRHSMAAAS